ncbi:MAG: class I SAM-dependent methyltransferase, partial [Jatrophihabitans sp.]
MDVYESVNRSWWDERGGAHATAPHYQGDRLVADLQAISSIVRYDRPRLGDLHGVRDVHLQCHIGTDTISLSRLGARMSGLDFSAGSLEQARQLAERAGVEVDFVEADVYDALGVLEPAGFDLVYTNIGALQYLPDIHRWGAVVAGLLREGGRLFLRETHPVLWALREPADGGTALLIDGAYFERPEPTQYDRSGSYARFEAEFVSNTCYEWNHGLGEIVTGLLDAGLQLTELTDHDTMPGRALPDMQDVGDGEYRLIDRPWRLPLT